MPIPGSILAKLDHAKFHLDALNSETKRYIGSNPGEFVSNPDGDAERPTFVYRQKFAPPPRISMLAGDCLGALRTTFDYLIWELVLSTGNHPTKQNAFPVCSTEASFKDASRQRLRGIPVDAKAFVQSLQPYTYFEPAQHWLGILDYLTNVNKHRRLLLSALGSFSMKSVMEFIESGISDDGRLAHDTNPSGIFMSEQVQMHGDLVSYVAFDEGAVEKMEVGIVIETYVGLVTQAVEQFGRFF